MGGFQVYTAQLINEFTSKLIPSAMQRNLINLLTVAVVVFFVFGCFCRSDKDVEVESTSNPATSQSNRTAAEKRSSAAKNSGDKKKDEGDFIVQQTDVQNPRYSELDRQMKADRVLEGAANQLNQSLSLPFDIFMRTKDCGQVNALYNPNDQSITVCYELMDYYFKLFKAAGESDDKAYDKMNNAIRFAFLHEVGHALIDAYKLPVMGNEEDAADRCSAYISLEEIPDGVKYVLAAADAFAIESKLSNTSKRNMADEHLLQEQRFYNSLCMIYGSNSTKYDYIVKDNYLPKARAVRCPGEYERTMQSWKDLLKPWRKD